MNPDILIPLYIFGAALTFTLCAKFVPLSNDREIPHMIIAFIIFSVLWPIIVPCLIVATIAVLLRKVIVND